MERTAFERLKRYNQLSDLSNVVLLDNFGAEGSRKHLEEKIQQRIDKEFPDPDSEEEGIIGGIKEKNLRFVDRTIKQHNNKEFFVQIGRNVREKDVHLFHKFSDNNLSSMELFIICDTLKRSGVKSITLYIPYIPYQRQDKKDDGRVPISAKLFFDLLSASAGVYLKRIVTCDLHAQQAQAHFNGPVDELSAIPEFAAYYRTLFKDEISEENKVLVISPDAGGAKRAKYLARLLGVHYAVLDKTRTGHGKAETNYYIPLDIHNRITLILDDVVDSASSVAGEYEEGKNGPIQYLLTQQVAQVHLCATHHELSRKNDIAAEERLRRANIKAVFADTLPQKYPSFYADNSDWMTIISMYYTLAKAFYCNQVGESISDFLKKREKQLRDNKLDIIASSDGQKYTIE